MEKIEDITAGKDPGNFLAFLNDYYNPRTKNATHLSLTTQNEIFNTIGYDFILDGIISAVQNTNYSR